jgi:hypothetical protein
MLDKGGAVLHRLIYANWDEPPTAMAFELDYREALRAVQERLAIVQGGLSAATADPAGAPTEYWNACLDLYLLTPALVNVALNYKVCVENGMPLHPTYYFEVTAKTRNQVAYPIGMLRRGQRFFLEAIDASLAVFRLDPTAADRLAALAADIPSGVGEFIYTSTPDKYTWRASDPSQIAALAENVRSSIAPVAIVGAAHGAIMAALVLAAMLATPLYFIRFSMFKRNDPTPVLCASDLEYLAQYRAGPVLLFDEDVAKGTTMTLFTETLRPHFTLSYTAGVLRNGYAGFVPDFVGRVWYD